MQIAQVLVWFFFFFAKITNSVMLSEHKSTVVMSPIEKLANKQNKLANSFRNSRLLTLIKSRLLGKHYDI